MTNSKCPEKNMREAAWFIFVPRGCMIFCCPKRLHDFFCPQRLHDFFPERLRDLFPLKGCVIFFVPRGCMIFFLLRCCVIFLPNRLHDFFCPKIYYTMRRLLPIANTVATNNKQTKNTPNIVTSRILLLNLWTFVEIWVLSIRLAYNIGVLKLCLGQ